MGKLQKIVDIKDLRKLRWWHLPQSIILAICFCCADTFLTASKQLWLISAGLILLVIIAIAYLFGKKMLGRWIIGLNILAVPLFVMAYYQIALAQVLLPVVLVGGLCVQILYSSRILNNYSALFFIVISLVGGLLLRYVFILMPEWICAILVALTIPRSLINYPINDTKITSTPITDRLNKGETRKRPNPLKRLILILLPVMIIFFLTVELFGSLATDMATPTLPMGINIYYISGIVIFMIIILLFRLKYASMFLLSIGYIALFLFLLPDVEIKILTYIILAIGGGIETVILIFPLEIVNQNKHYYIYVAGLFVLRFAFFLKGLAAYLFADIWFVSNNQLTSALLGIIVITGVALVILIIVWDKYANQQVILEKENSMQNKAKSLPESFSEREKQVAKLLLGGYDADTIAHILFISLPTVRKHIRQILIKSNSKNQKIFILNYK